MKLVFGTAPRFDNVFCPILQQTMNTLQTPNDRGFLPVVIALLLTIPLTATAAPDADLWGYWTTHNPDSEKTVNHDAWASFLDKYLVQSDDGINRVRYETVTDADRKNLVSYLENLQDVPITNCSRPVQMAYWLNLYNALTVRVILDHYPVDSIRDIDISPGWFSDGPWGKELVTVEDKKLSLNDIEHRILRPIWKDPRIHYAVNCASLSCPNLLAEPFRADTLEKMLNKAARGYVNHPRGVRIRDDRLIVSSIYSWYQSDFGDSEREVIEHLMVYADDDLKKKLRSMNEIYDYRYDWGLNDVGKSWNP